MSAKKYLTEEGRRLANNEKARRYYHRNIKKIRKKQRQKYKENKINE